MSSKVDRNAVGWNWEWKFCKSELLKNSDKWLSLGVNKMTFYVATLYKKYQNISLDVQDSQWYCLFSWKSAERCLNLNTKLVNGMKLLNFWNSSEPAMFRASFVYLRGRIWGGAWKESFRKMLGIQLLFWTISKFGSGIWRNRGSKSGVFTE